MPQPAQRRPEQSFFPEPALDRAVGMIMTLAAELYVVRDRLRCLERTLEKQGQLDPARLDAYEPSAEEQSEIERDRDAFVESLLSHVAGRQASKGVG